MSRPLMTPFRQTRKGREHPIQQAARGGGIALNLRVDPEIFRNRYPREHQPSLQQQREATPHHPVTGRAGQVRSLKDDRSRPRPGHTGDHFHRRLARAVAARKRDNLARSDGQGNPPDRLGASVGIRGSPTRGRSGISFVPLV